MDGFRFDELTKTAAFGSSRRSLLKTVVGLGLAGLLGKMTLDETAAAPLRSAGAICRKPGDCASGVCGPKDGTGRQRCGCAADTDCQGGLCVSGACVPCPTCYVPGQGGQCVRVMEPMNGRCPCGFEEMNGQCVKNACRDCFENIGGVCVPEQNPPPDESGLCQCGFQVVGGVCVPRYPLS